MDYVSQKDKLILNKVKDLDFFTLVKMFLLEAALCFLFCIYTNAQAPVVETANGKVIGRVDETYLGHNKFYSYLGIPYAAPPVGDLRFEKPQPPKNWEGTLNATEDGSKCIQGGGTRGPLVGSEDCLFLNVYKPATQSKKPLEVLVFIHGGFFYAGDNSASQIGLDNFIDRNLIAVSINYRLGAFGFLTTADGVIPANLGLRDMVMALKWVKTNIGNFGGDPSKVTVFGQSAGAAAIHYLCVAEGTSGLFIRAITSSGDSLCRWSLTRNPKKVITDIAASLGIFSNDSQKLHTELKKVKAEDLQEKAKNYDTKTTFTENALNLLRLSPSIEYGDIPDALLPEDSLARLEKGNFLDIDYLTGFNSLEMNGFLGNGAFYAVIRLALMGYITNLASLVPTDMNVPKLQILKAGREIQQKYLPRSIASSDKDIYKWLSVEEFVRPIIKGVRLRKKKSNIYMYMFDYVGGLSTSLNNNIEGVQHTADLEYIFKPENTSNISKEDLFITNAIVTFYTNFIKTGNPTPKEDPKIQNIIWKPNKASSVDIHYLYVNSSLQILKNPFSSDMEFWDKFYETYGKNNRLTY